MRERFVNSLRAGVIFLACVAQAPLPGVGQDDRRVPVPLDAAPFRSLLRVQTELGARCTGFLLAPNLVMTAAHCLYLPKVAHYLLPSSVHVLLGYRAGAYRAHARARAFRIAPGYDSRRESATAGADRAILVLDRPIGTAADVLGLASPPATLPAPATLAGYGQDRDEVAVAAQGCAVIGLARDGQGRPLLAHDCQATAGTSGAPLLMRQADGHWVAIGVQIEARVGPAGGLAGGLAVPALD
ncbi:trypsin-like serine protease [Acetobacteraceae bacterium KSS8]|uniref:Trypsin-like serine protease n=1 Tax=Endosaccharibacter trunci TaxID=2812733 RepID=A0ABT1W5S2_9PROT|nr:trypsin-like serine protease [Acetobacteraceae bacterium KSS8]